MPCCSCRPLDRPPAPRPDLVLLDEPFAALDLGLRRTVRDDGVSLLRHHGATAVLVTHDPQETFASADLVAVMQDGQVIQYAEPLALYRRPVDADVAQLTGAAIILGGTMGAAGSGRPSGC
jgi:iron(III) transport system ATP-binding protein